MDNKSPVGTALLIVLALTAALLAGMWLTRRLFMGARDSVIAPGTSENSR